MGSAHAGRQMPSLHGHPALLRYCDRGASGPAGAAGGALCCWSDFFSESRMPPEVGGAIGVAPPAGCDCEAGVVPMIEIGARL